MSSVGSPCSLCSPSMISYCCIVPSRLELNSSFAVAVGIVVVSLRIETLAKESSRDFSFFGCFCFLIVSLPAPSSNKQIYLISPACSINLFLSCCCRLSSTLTIV